MRVLVQGRDGARPPLERLRRALESVSGSFADGGCSGRLLAVAESAWGVVVEIVKKSAPAPRPAYLDVGNAQGVSISDI
ncbi:MAG: hypothetical protein ACRDKL_07385 [Solirubrobacteraceae bacterium]